MDYKHCIEFTFGRRYNEDKVFQPHEGQVKTVTLQEPNASPAHAVSANLLDRYFFETLRDQSKLLTRYQALLTSLSPGFATLLEDLFYLLYKIEPVLLDSPTTARAIVGVMTDSYTLKKLRGRTAASAADSYVALKLLVDELLLRLRGTEIPTQLETLTDALEALKASQSALFEAQSGLGEAASPLSPQNAARLNRMKQPLGIPQESTLSDTARALADALRAMNTAQKDLASQSQEVSENATKPIQPKISDQKPSPLNQALKSALSPDLSSFLERLDAVLETENTTSQESPLQDGKDTDQSGDPSQMEKMSQDLESELRALAVQMDATGPPPTSEALVPAGLAVQETHGQTHQSRLMDGSGTGHPMSASIMGFEGHTSAGGGTGGLQQALEHLGERITRLEGQIADVLRPLDVQLAMNRTMESLDRFTENLKTLGVNTELESTEDFDHVLELYKALGDPAALRFLNKVGKKREIARRAQTHKKRKMQYLIDKVASGDRFDALIDEEIMTLSLEVFSSDFYDRFLNRSLLVYDMEGHTARDRGPIILCYDGSGSMEGIKIEETKALLVAFIEVARIQKRRLITLQFASKTEPLYIQEFNPHHVTLEEIMALLAHFIRGGTDFETPLKAAVSLLKEDQYRHGDILMITDGFSDIHPDFKKAFSRTKAAMAFKLYAIIIHGETYGDYGDLGEISDEILEIRDRDLSNWNEKISAQLFERI